MAKKDLSWESIQKEVLVAYEPFRVISKKLRTEIEFKDGVFCTDNLSNVIELFLKKMADKDSENLFLPNVETMKLVQERLPLFTEIANELEDEERVVLYYLMIKEQTESETEIAENRMIPPCSRSKINSLKRSAFTKLLESFYYNKIMSEN